MLRRFTHARISHLKLIIYSLLGFCLFSVYLWSLKKDPVYDLSKYPEVLVDAVQQKPMRIHSKDKQDLLSSKEYSKPDEKQNLEILSEIGVYYRDRVLKIKQNCGDVCKTEQTFLINGMLVIYTYYDREILKK